MSEFDLIAGLRARLGAIAGQRLSLGIGDDAAVWLPTPGHESVVCCDTLIEGRHFPRGTTPGDLAWKALAVNLSDLAAMGARPFAALLALSLPERPGPAWVDGFCQGWAVLAQAEQVALAGGDTTRGPVLSLTVTCLGELPAGTALRRDGARAGDGVYVSGTLGDAAAALALLGEAGQAVSGVGPDDMEALAQRLRRPLPRLALGQALRGIASAAIDVSDGLLADLGHVLAASGVGARLDAARLPLSDELLRAVSSPQALQHALAGGDDYELCFTVPAGTAPERLAAAAGSLRITCIGEVTAQPGLSVHDAHGRPMTIAADGWDHFR